AGKGLADIKLDELEAAAPTSPDTALKEIFEHVSGDKMMAARKTLAWAKSNTEPKPLIDAARGLTFMKGTDSHGYKFGSAVLEDCQRISPGWREKYLASSMYWLKGSGAKESGLLGRTRAALS